MAVRTQSNEVVEVVHDRDRCIQREGRQRAFVTDFNVFVIAAADTTPRLGGAIPAAGVLPKSGEAASRMLGVVRDRTDRL